MDARAFNALSCGVYIISAAANGKNAGCIVNTVTQVTAQPAKLLAAVNKDNYTAGVIRAAGVRGVRPHAGRADGAHRRLRLCLQR